MKDIVIASLVIFILFVCSIQILRAWNKQARKRSREQRRKQGKIDPISSELINLGNIISWIIFGKDKESFVAFDKTKSRIIAGVCSYGNIQESINIDDFELTSTTHNLGMNIKQYYIAISNPQEQLAIFCFGNKIIRKIINFDSIISVEVLENGRTTYTKSTTRTIGGVIIGSIVAGGAGAIIGGITGKTTKEQHINSLKIKILLRDVDNPTYTIDWYEGEDLDITFGTSQKIYERCMNIKDVITVIIDKVDSKEKTQSDSNIKTKISFADEILKLSKLKDMGILTNDEFENKKKSLLS